MASKRILSALLFFFLVSMSQAQVKYGTRAEDPELLRIKRQNEGTVLPDGYWLNTGRTDIFDQKNRFYLFSTIDPFSFESLSLIHELEKFKEETPSFEVFLLVTMPDEQSFNWADLRNLIIREDISLPLYVANGEPHRHNRIRYDSLPNTHVVSNDFRMMKIHHGVNFGESLDSQIESLKNGYKLSVIELQENKVGYHDGIVQNNRVEGILNYPSAIEVSASSEKMWIWSSGEHQILELDLDGNVTNIIGNGKKGHKDGTYLRCEIGHSGDLSYNSKSNLLYFTDHYSNTLRVVDLDKESVSTLLGNGEYASGKLAPKIKGGTEQALQGPNALVGKGEDLFFTMSGDHSIWKYNLTSKEAERVLGQGEPGSTDGKKKKALLNEPGAIAINREGELYFTDRGTGTLRMWDGKKLKTLNDAVLGKGGHKLLSLGDSLLLLTEYEHLLSSLTEVRGLQALNEAGIPGYQDGRLNRARFSYPCGASWANGLIYLTDAGNQCIRVFDPELGFVNTMPLRDMDRVFEERVVYDELSNLNYLEEVQLAEGENFLRLNIELPPGFSIPEGAYSTVYLLDDDNDQLLEFDPKAGEILFSVDGNSVNPHLTFEFVLEYVEEAKPLVKLLRTCRVFVPFNQKPTEEEPVSVHTAVFWPLKLSR